MTEAYEVLSDENSRAAYDRGGWRGVSGEQQSGGGHRGSAARGFPAYAGSRASFGHAEDIFRAFFGGQDPFADMMNLHSNMMAQHEELMMRAAGAPPRRSAAAPPPPFGHPEDPFARMGFGGGLGGGLLGGGLLGGGGGGMLGGGFMGGDDPFLRRSHSVASASSSSSSSSSFGGAGGGFSRSKSMRTSWVDGRQLRVTEERTVYPDGRVESSSTTEDITPAAQLADRQFPPSAALARPAASSAAAFAASERRPSGGWRSSF